MEHCVCSEAARLFQSAGCVRNKLQFCTVQEKQKIFPLDGIPALDLWDLIVTVLHGHTNQNKQVRGGPCTNLVRAAPHKLQVRKKSHGKIDDLNNVDLISLNVISSRKEALMYIFEDNEEVIKMIIKEGVLQ